jgi:hypothetical protein
MNYRAYRLKFYQSEKDWMNLFQEEKVASVWNVNEGHILFEHYTLVVFSTNDTR